MEIGGKVFDIKEEKMCKLQKDISNLEKNMSVCGCDKEKLLLLESLYKEYNKLESERINMLEKILKEYFGLCDDYEEIEWYNSYGLLINLLYELDNLGVITDVDKIVDRLDKIGSEVC